MGEKTQMTAQVKASSEDYAEQGGLSCPVCGSDQIEGGQFDVDQHTATQKMGCNDCESDWQDTYRLVGYVNLDNALVKTEEENAA